MLPGVTDVDPNGLSRRMGAFPAPEPGQDHPDALTVTAVLITEQGNQVALFKPDSDKDVSSGDSSKKQMTDRHARSRPERDDEAKIDWMAHDLVEHRCLELHGRLVAADQIVGDLMQSKQLEMIDQEG